MSLVTASPLLPPSAISAPTSPSPPFPAASSLQLLTLPLEIRLLILRHLLRSHPEPTMTFAASADSAPFPLWANYTLHRSRTFPTTDILLICRQLNNELRQVLAPPLLQATAITAAGNAGSAANAALPTTLDLRPADHLNTHVANCLLSELAKVPPFWRQTIVILKLDRVWFEKLPWDTLTAQLEGLREVEVKLPIASAGWEAAWRWMDCWRDVKSCEERLVGWSHLAPGLHEGVRALGERMVGRLDLLEGGPGDESEMEGGGDDGEGSRRRRTKVRVTARQPVKIMKGQGKGIYVVLIYDVATRTLVSVDEPVECVEGCWDETRDMCKAM
ncbi:uncharacterized protein AB675_5141 [Cyphellophora attinorum]|uniref:F-box domain-containing protein n=1 Tax=Cyphellophora attinorum TaxID=1664694 RepID=A0A0N1NZX2_9EURO|nr:uncharacterized protein AB675_5141 [Phialophora attinorum]KPI39412.1 hypothetical protein AB675_5141 [Phialophora attinorum]